MPSLSQQQITRLSQQLSGQKRDSRNVQGIKPSVAVEASYRRRLLELVSVLEKISLTILDRLRDRGLIQDADIPDFPDMVTTGLQSRISDYEEYAVELSTRLVTKSEQFHRRNFVAELKRKAGVDVSNILSDPAVADVLQNRIKENVALIKSIPEQYFDKIRTAITFGIDTGEDYFSIKKEVKHIGNVTESRAKLIARDQTSKLFGELNQARQNNIGITHYIWRTAGDERVRPEHQDNNGKRFSWQSPPSTGHPGEDIQCRCVAEPDMSNLISKTA